MTDLRTWTSAASCLFGKRGLIRQTYRPWRDYLRPGFHPSQQDSSVSRLWLGEHTDRYIPVGSRP